MAKEFNYEIFKKAAIDQIKKGGNFSGKNNVMLPMIKDLLESALNEEMDLHMNEGRSKDDQSTPNRKNGITPKQMKCEQGSFEHTRIIY